MSLPILSILIFFPMLGVALITMLDRENQWVIKGTALTVAVLEFVASLPLWFGFNGETAAMQFVERYSWFPSYGISYYIGIDGISLLLVLLTTFFTPICVLACWQDIQDKVKEFVICLLFLETGMIGVFVSLDLFLFYVFWEVMLIPMYLLIGVWGAPARRIYAAVKFFLFTMFGSLLMLVAILVLYFYHQKVTGIYTFDLLKIYGLQIPFHMQFWMFLAFALAFAIKVPMFPVHTWLPDAHTEAPTVGSVILAAVLLKMGTYGFLRFNMPLFPEAAWYCMPLFCILAIIGIIYGALVSMMQKDLKRLVAFSSVSHLGFVMLGLFTFTMAGVQGGIIQMINHGLSTGALFLIVGMIYERRHTRMIEDFGGLSTTMPIYATIFMIVTLSSIGLPGLNGFVGEFLILLGTFKVNKIFAVFAASGVIFAACYMLWMFQRVMFGKVTHKENEKLPDLSIREIVVLAPILLFIVWIGVYPNTFLDKTRASTENFVAQMEKAKAPKVALVDVIKGDIR
jgi:NADH-quinone oxidoreductase subunit M